MGRKNKNKQAQTPQKPAQKFVLPLENPALPPIIPTMDEGKSSQGHPALSRTEVRASRFSGPLPPPEILQEYDRVVPGAAARILAMAEKQADHRHQLESNVINHDIVQARQGLWCGLGLSVLVILTGGFLIYNGHDVAGGITIGLDLVALAGVFVYGTATRKAERLQKAEIMAGNKPAEAPAKEQATVACQQPPAIT